MAKESINEIIGKEGFEQIERLYKELGVLTDRMNESIQTVDSFNKALGKSTSAKDVASSIKEISKAQETLESTTKKTTATQKQLADETGRVAAALRENQNNLKTHAAETGKAGDKLQTLQRQIRSLRNELSGEMLAMSQLNEKIKQQKIEVDRLLKSKGAESNEYRKATNELNKLTTAQNTSSAAIQELQIQGGKLQDIYGDASKRIRALSSDFANTDAAVQGVGVMIDAYTVLQATMVGLGIESEQLMDIFAKLMILQQGINSVSQITKALQSESILRTKLETAALWVKNTYNEKLVASQLANNTATKAGNVIQNSSIGIISKVKAALQTLNAVLMKNPWILIIAAIAAAVIAFKRYANKKNEDDIEAMNKKLGAQTNHYNNIGISIDNNVKIMQAQGKSEKQILNYRKEQAQLIIDDINAKKTQLTLTTDLNTQQTQSFKKQMQNYDTIKKKQSDNIKEINFQIGLANAAEVKSNQDKYRDNLDELKRNNKQTLDEIHNLELEKLNSEELHKAKLKDLNNSELEEINKIETLKKANSVLYEEFKFNIQQKYTLKREKLEVDYTESEKERLEKLSEIQAAHFDKMKKWAVEAYNELSGNTRMQEENELNDLIIQGVEDTEAEKLRIRQNYATEERKLFKDAKDVLIAGGMSQEEWTNKYKQLKAEETIAAENSNNFQIQSEKALREERQAAAMEAVAGFASLGSAIAQNIKDEKERMRVEAAIALVQALVNEGAAIAEVIADKGDPYTKAFRIVANVAAITAAMVTATAAFSQASSAMPYAEGTDYHKGGNALVGEEYKPELVLMRNEKPLVVDKPTFFKDMPIGSKVIPFSKIGNDNMMSMSETNELLKSIRDKQTVNVNVSEKITTYLSGKFGYTKILNSKFKV